jgi:RNA polymerase sigma-70 factor (ECF subfamily)
MNKGNIIPFQTTDREAQLAIRADKALAKLAASGDREAFNNIVDLNKQRMFTVARSVAGDPSSAEDIVQEAFIKAYRALPNFRGDSRLSTWLHRITYLTAIDHRRQLGRHLQLAGVQESETEIADPSPMIRSDSEIQRRQLQSSIEQAMDKLSDFEQTVFTLRHMQNFKLREIAKILDRSEGTIKNILFRAIQKMRDQLADIQSINLEREKC